MKFFSDIINEINKDEVNNYYNIENHSQHECAMHFDISDGLFIKLLKYYNIKKDVSKHNELIARKKEEKYGNSTYNNRDKSKQTCLEKYGVDNPFRDTQKIKNAYIEKLGVSHPMENDEIKNKVISKHNYEESISKARQTYFEKTGFDNPGKNPDAIKKGLETKIKKGVYDSPGTSNLERRLEKILIRKFGNIKTHYRDKRYARISGYQFECDFYIPELDLFIELNAHPTHYNCPFDSSNEQHKYLAEQLKNSTKKWDNNTYKIWCEFDYEKQQIAIQNNLNYIVLYPTNSIFNNQQFNNKRYSELISYLIKKLNDK